MNRRDIDPFQAASQVLGSLSKGILLNSKSGNTFDSMVIGWGAIGIEWNKPIFICYVREGRFTRTLIDRSREFTVCAPLGKLDSRAFLVCGSKSARDVDKVKEGGLTLVEPVANGVPGVMQAPITLECKVLYSHLQDRERIPAIIREQMYPQDVPSSEPMRNKDYHVAYYGEIVASYVIEG